jgi:hypothetical protein
MDDADGACITIDNAPNWGDANGLVTNEGFKVTYQTVARRYYLNHRIWINHPDLLFFRTSDGLTLEESRTWATAVALTGGIVKLGEPFTVMESNPDWADVVHRMIPVVPKSGRPLDLFDRFYPEVWDLPLQRDAQQWHAVGLFNWGLNQDVGASAWEPETVHTIGVDRTALGLSATGTLLAVDGWTGAVTRITGTRVEASLQPRSVALLLVRPDPTAPALVWTSRHLMGGAAEVSGETWDAATGTWSATIDAPAGAPLTVEIATGGATPSSATADGTALTPQVADGVATLALTPAANPAHLAVTFAAP